MSYDMEKNFTNFGTKHSLSNTVRILKIGSDLAKKSSKNRFSPAEFPEAAPAVYPEVPPEHLNI